ncbi:uncharacterized protein MONBRDRAFT_19405 [Monosiga brevicollis MX1]|uniref:Translation initiation factor eIF2B subunit alpha n=1 Tax=Monosiga brevicollis TaxID=81824 RepID=A9UQZ5_MONBE|nr:uncharacterized protein MONBRDRAFT_19405 [Monosiga brevicollis MX1]EDQ92685.1 predicted protein [Monosiga brevicollis MX1]|eukprot:XP_001742447.1 hypothetical protein [Monosiga brevicollis MX1]
MAASDGQQEWVEYFKRKCEEDPAMSSAVAAMHTLLAYLQQSKAETLAELRDSVNSVVAALIDNTEATITSVSSGCELFIRFITLNADAASDFATCLKLIVENGRAFLEKAQHSRMRIAPKGVPFIRDGTTVLTLARSRVVQEVLLEATKRNKRFSVLVTESRPSGSGLKMAEWLQQHNIPATVIADSAVGYIIDQVDFVICGAEAVVESGGIINSIGTYQAAMAAKCANKPFYAVAESFKFVRLFPLSQKDLPANRDRALPNVPPGVESLNPLFDYTPPAYVTLLFSDLGVLTPSAVSDELIKLYY